MRSNFGEMAEWSIAAVLKTVELRGSMGSNPFLSAEYNLKNRLIFEIFLQKKRKDARVVEWDGLENRCTHKGTEGSNPPLSAAKTKSHESMKVRKHKKLVISELCVTL